MATFHTHFPLDPDPRDVSGCTGHDALRAYWREHGHDAPAVKPQRDVVANNRRAGDKRRKAQDEHYNGLVLMAFQLVTIDGLPIVTACAQVGISEGTYRKRARRLGLDTSPVE